MRVRSVKSKSCLKLYKKAAASFIVDCVWNGEGRSTIAIKFFISFTRHSKTGINKERGTITYSASILIFFKRSPLMSILLSKLSGIHQSFKAVLIGTERNQ